MPKRLLDSSFLDSPSMEALSPGAQDAFPRFILLADDFGCFEVNPDRLRANGWSKRPDITQDDVTAWLYEYGTRRAPGCPPVAIFWTVTGRRYCHLTGWFGERGQRKRAEYDPTTEAGRKGSKRRTPAPPADLVAAVLSGEVRADGFPPGSDVFPLGFAAGGETGKPSDSVPARETAGNPDSRSVPAHAVPAAVAVPAAAASRAGLPLKGELVGGENPGCSALRLRLAEEGFDLAWPAPDKRQTIEAAVVRCGVEPCVTACLADAKGMKVPPKSLGIFATTLAALRPPEPESRPKTVPIVDLAWLDQLPEPTRSEARAAWEERRNEVETTFAPETHPHWLAAGAEVLRARYTQ